MLAGGGMKMGQVIGQSSRDGGEPASEPVTIADLKYVDVAFTDYEASTLSLERLRRLFFAPIANVVLGSVRGEEEGQASGANNAVRELGGVFGVAETDQSHFDVRNP